MAIRKLLRRLLLAGFLAALPALARPPQVTGTPNDYRFLSPLPASTRVLPETNIILRPGGVLAPSLLSGIGQIGVEGSISGPCSGRVHVSDDQSTITFQPDQPFAFGEVVTVRVAASDGAETSSLPPVAFQFTI